MTTRLETIYRAEPEIVGYVGKYFQYLIELLSQVDRNSIAKLIELLIDVRAKGNSIYVCGNGGSATTASHFANDLGKGAKTATSSFKVISLTDNVSWLTALGNDEGYERVFEGQLENFITDGDVVIGFSASGNSPNVIRALELANRRNAVSVAIVGFDGGKMSTVAKHTIHIRTNKGEYGPVEDIHLMLVHIITTYIHYLDKIGRISSDVKVE